MAKKTQRVSRAAQETAKLRTLLDMANGNYSSLLRSSSEECGKLAGKIDLLERALDTVNRQLSNYDAIDRKLAMAQGQIAGMREVLGQLDHVKMLEPSKIPPRTGMLRQGTDRQPSTAAELLRNGF